MDLLTVITVCGLEHVSTILFYRQHVSAMSKPAGQEQRCLTSKFHKTTACAIDLVVSYSLTKLQLAPLHLCSLRLDAGFAEHLRSRCPALEDLELKGCDCRFRELVSATLRNLVADADGRGYPAQLVATAPALKSIRLVFGRYTNPRSFVLNGAAGSLSRACIDDGFAGSLDKNLFAILGSMCNVRTLELWRCGYRSVRIINLSSLN